MKAKKRSSTRVTRRVSVPKVAVSKRQRSSISENTALLLALFFSLVALMLVLVNKKQSDDLRRLLNSRMQDQILLVPGRGADSTPIPKVIRNR